MGSSTAHWLVRKAGRGALKVGRLAREVLEVGCAGVCGGAGPLLQHLRHHPVGGRPQAAVLPQGEYQDRALRQVPPSPLTPTATTRDFMRDYPASLAWGSLPPSSLPDVSFQPHGYLFLATQVTQRQDRAHCN